MEEKKMLQLLAERVAADPALAEEASKITTAEELAALAGHLGVTLSDTAAAGALPRLKAMFADNSKLGEDALDTVAGGYGYCKPYCS